MRFKNPFSLGTDLWDPSHRFETSWLLPPWLLFACRALIAVYTLTTRFFIIGWTCDHSDLGGCSTARRSFSYFTILCFWGEACYFLISSIHTFTYAARARPLLDRFPRPLQALHSLFYTTIVTYPFLVTIVYWGVLYSNPWYAKEFDAWSNISQHGMNSLFGLFELFMTRTAPPPWIHLLWLIVILLGYLAVAFITLADQGWYVYGFLDYREVGGRGYVAAYVIGIAVGICIIFAIVWGLIWLRRWITEKKLGMEGKFAKQQNRRSDEEMNTFGTKRHNGRQVETQEPAAVYQPNS